MTLEECEDAYLTLSRKVFRPRRSSIFTKKLDLLAGKGCFDEKVLEEAIKEFIKMKLPDLCPEVVLLKDPELGRDKGCRTYVIPCAVHSQNSA